MTDSVVAPATGAIPLIPPPDADEAEALVRRWLDHERHAAAAGVARSRRETVGEQRLAALLKDPAGLAFTIGFVDRVVRPEDLRVAARSLETLSHTVPRFLPWYLRAAVVIGGAAGIILPWPVVPIARRVFRRMVGHLVIDATPQRLGRAFHSLRTGGVRLNVNLLGEAVLGEHEAQNRLDGTRRLLARDDVDYVSVKVSSVASRLSMWGFDETVARVVERLTPLYRDAALAGANGTAKFINLDMEEYRDLDLTVAVFTRLLEQPELRGLEAGIVLQAYLPDTLAALQELTAWARNRVREGGAPIKVRIVKGANLAMERVDALLHGWPLATWPSKQSTDANYLRLLDWALRPSHTDAVRIGVAGHNLFDLAWALLLAERRMIADRVDVEMLLGMASAHQDAIRSETGRLLLYTPVVQPSEFDSAIAYLVRRLEENASTENFMSHAFELSDAEVFELEGQRFRASLAEFQEGAAVPPRPNRTQNRLTPGLPWLPRPFGNEPDTDPSRAPNRSWGRQLLADSAASVVGADVLAAAAVTDAAGVDHLVASASRAGRTWASAPAAQRAELLNKGADALAAWRGRLIEVMASETAKTIAEADAEVSEAIDFARYYASIAPELETVPEARFRPAGLVVVAPPWNFPVSIPAGGVLAALASGSAAILKPAPQARRCAAVLVQALHEGGIPREALVLADVPEGPLGQRLITDPAVGRVILTGSYETAELFRSWDPELPLLAETSGKNAVIVTPSADLDHAVDDIVHSAFSNAGQKCSAASLAILVGSVARSERFLRQLQDAVSSLAVGWPSQPDSYLGPVVQAPDGKLLRALTLLGEGEAWLVRPKQLDSSGRLWSPGVKTGVQPGSEFHRVEYFGPVLGIMTARTLGEAIGLQNAVEFGLTAGIESLDAREVAQWIDTVQAGNLYVNRPITGAIVRRQPFGGWKRSAVGPGAKAGGPNALHVLGSWTPVPAEPTEDLHLDGVSDRVRAVIEASEPSLGFDGFASVRRGVFSDQAAWDAEFRPVRDPSGLGIERNLFRYVPTDTTIRLTEGGDFAEFIRVVAAGIRSGARLRLSTPSPLPDALSAVIDPEHGVAPVLEAAVESDADFLATAASGRMASRGPNVEPVRLPAATRIRLVAPLDSDIRGALAETLPTHVAVWSAPVTAAGRIELLPFLREQAVSITAHRFGARDAELADLPV